MNKERRKQLTDLAEELEGLTAALQEVIDGESDALDNLPENLRNSSRADDMQYIIDDLEDVHNSLEEAQETILEIRDR